MFNCGLKSEEVAPSEYVAKIKSVIGNDEAYLIYIPSIGFRCVVDASEVLREVAEEELSDEDKGREDEILFTAPNLYTSGDAYKDVHNDGRYLLLAVDAMTKLYPEDKIVSAEQCHSSDYMKSDLLAIIDNFIGKQKKKSRSIQKKREHFREMLEHLRFKEYYDVRVGVEDKLDENATNYIYVAVDTKCTDATIRRNMGSDGQRFYHSLGPEYDSIYSFFCDLRQELIKNLYQ
jgi:hypothetical protein